MPRRLFSAAAAGALLLGLAACGDTTDGPATAPPPDLGIAAPSDGGGDPAPSDGGGEQTDPSADAPDIPPPDPADFAGMDENTPEGAEQAFRYYIAVSMWAHQTGKDTKLTPLQSADCSGCSELNHDLPSLKEHGDYWGEFTVSDNGTTLHDSQKYDHEVGYFFTIPPHSRPNHDFTSRVDAPEIEYITVGGMEWDSDKWIVSGLNAEWGEGVHDSSN